MIFLNLLGCIGAVGNDTGDTATVGTGLAFEARMHVWCTTGDCSKIGLFGGASGDDVVDYFWIVDGLERDSGVDNITIDLTGNTGRLTLAELTVTNGDGDTSHTSMYLAPLTTTVDAIEVISAVVVMPPPVACSAAIPVASIGGCMQNVQNLRYGAFDYDSYGALSQRGGWLDFEPPTGTLTSSSFVDYAAWYQASNNNGNVNFLGINASQYQVGAPIYKPYAMDPVLQQVPNLVLPGGSQLQDHFTFWFTAQSYGTELQIQHLDGDGKEVAANDKIVATCSSDDTLSFTMVPNE